MYPQIDIHGTFHRQQLKQRYPLIRVERTIIWAPRMKADDNKTHQLMKGWKGIAIRDESYLIS